MFDKIIENYKENIITSTQELIKFPRYLKKIYQVKIHLAKTVQIV